MRLGPDDVNLQTEEIHYNYSVFIESAEQEKNSLLYYPTIIIFQENYQEKEIT